MNKLKEVLAGPSPVLAVVINPEVDDGQLEDIARVADAAEFRADLFGTKIARFLSPKLLKLSLPTILTIRSQEEGGQWDGYESQRLSLFRSLLPYVDGVDVELKSEILPEVTKIAHDMGNVVIASYHNFATTPPTAKMETKFNMAMDAGADYFKLAAEVEDKNQYKKLAEFIIGHSGKNDDGNLIVLGMGEQYGPKSRIEFPVLGSRLTYAYAGTAVADGQMDYAETRAKLNEVLNTRGII